MNSGGAADGLGTVQDWSTGNPRNQFSIGGVGDHAHPYSHYQGRIPLYSGYDIVNGDYPIAQDSLGNFQTGPGGGHSHSLVGGDAETRPINAVVNFMIKC